MTTNTQYNDMVSLVAVTYMREAQKTQAQSIQMLRDQERNQIEKNRVNQTNLGNKIDVFV